VESGGKADEGAVAAEVKQADIPGVAFFHHQPLVAQGQPHLGQIVRIQQAKHAHQQNGQNPDIASILQPYRMHLGTTAPDLRIAGQAAEQRQADHQRHHDLHHRYAKIAHARIQPHGKPLADLGKKKLVLDKWDEDAAPPMPQQAATSNSSGKGR
jgi:hypothetical protein